MQSIKDFNKQEVMVMKLLHYFIVTCGYNPIVVHGVKDEIWLENLQTTSKYKIVRIVSDYIHNGEQYEYDVLKTKSIVSNIKKKTFNWSIKVLTIFTDLNDEVEMAPEKSIDCASVHSEKDLSKYQFIYDNFPSIKDNLVFDEKGMELFMRITNDINQKNKTEAAQVENIFKPKVPVVTIVLIAINALVFLFSKLFNADNFLIQYFSTYGPLIREGAIYRLITGAFVHVDFLHIFCNMWALYIVGSQIETLFGRSKYLIIYFASLLGGSLLSILMHDTASIGASGAIFGLMGALVYFGYYYRVYLGDALKTKILPVILINLIIGFTSTGIDNAAHIGGLIAGIIVSSCVGINFKGENQRKNTNFVICFLFYAFLIIMNIVVKR